MAVTVFAAAVHELGHLTAIRLFGGRVRSVGLGAAGAEIRFNGSFSYTGDMITALAGPLASAMLTGACVLIFDRVPEPFVSDTAAVSALYAAVNLIPASPLDGGRALHSLICRLFGPDAGDWTGIAADTVCSAGALLGGFYVLIKTRGNISALICAIFLLYACCKMRRFGV